MNPREQDPQSESGENAGATDDQGELNVSPASPSDLEDELPAFQPGEGPGQTPGE